MKMFKITLLVLCFAVAAPSFASAPVKAVASSVTSTTLAEVIPAPSATPEGSKVDSALKKIDDAIPGDLAVWILAALAFLAELIMRLFPTLKPKSILLLLASIFTSVGSIFTKLSGLLDKIAQNIKDKEQIK